MIQAYKKFAGSLLSEIRRTDLVKLAIYTAISAVASIWPVIALEEAGYGTSKAFMIHAFDNWISVLALLFISVVHARKKLLRLLWLSVTWMACLGWFFLAFTGFNLASYFFMMVLLVTVVLTHVAAVCLFADTLDQVQTGEAGLVKLALFMFLVPFLKLTFIGLNGVLADISFVYVAMFLGGCLLISNLIWHDHVVLHTLKVTTTEKVWHMFKDKKRLKLILLSALSNTFNVPTRFVFVPLYFYEKTGGSASKLGAFLALLGVVALFAQASKRYLQGKNLNTHFIMILGISLYICVPLLWCIYFDTIWLVAILLLLGEILSVVWSYGYFAELRKLNHEAPTVCTQQWQIVNGILVGVSCFILAFMAEDLMNYVRTYLLVQFIAMAVYIIYFRISSKKV